MSFNAFLLNHTHLIWQIAGPNIYNQMSRKPVRIAAQICLLSRDF